MTRISASDIRALLRRRYSSPEWALFFEVANSTGTGASRYADAVAMNLYPSRGLVVVGFEIKVSKSDFINEVRNPEKSVSIQKYCDRWYIVAPAEAVDESLLPENWGWLQVTGEQIRLRKEGPKLKPEALSREFVAAMVRRGHESEQADIASLVKLQIDGLRKQDEERIQREVKARTQRADESIKKLEDLKAKIGNDSWDWLDNEDVAAAVRLVRKAGVTSTYSGLRQVEKELKRCADRVRGALDGAFGEQKDMLDAAE
jgi:hypothetical protein